jgi:hypothetical protein
MISLLPQYRHDPNLPHYIDAADQVISWRDTVPPQQRFWAEEDD